MHRNKFKYSEEERLKMYEDWGFLEYLTMFTLLALFCSTWYVPFTVYQIQEKQDALYELVKAKVAAAEEHPTAGKAFSLDNLVKYAKPDGGMSNVSKPRAVSNKHSGYYTGGSIVMRGPRPKDLRPSSVQLPHFVFDRSLTNDEIIARKLSNIAELKLESIAVSVGNFLSEIGVEGFKTRTFDANRLKEPRASLGVLLSNVAEGNLNELKERVRRPYGLSRYEATRLVIKALAKGDDEQSTVTKGV